MTISCSKLGALGRMGNQCFQLASMIGLSRSRSCDLALPHWKYAKYFQGPIPEGNPRGIQVKEPAFHYSANFIPNDGKDYDVVGYLQSEKYWKHCEKEVRDILAWEPKFLANIKAKYAEVFEKKTICISVRQGDYRGNPNYELLPAMYYILSLYAHYPDWKERNLLFVSDDMDWCRLHFKCLPNAYFATDFKDKDYFFDESAIEQMCVASLCDDFIISNSTFGWWLAYLANRGKVVRPAHYLAGKLKQQCDMKDFWPEGWIEFDHKWKKFDLKDVTFTVPVYFDHNDRKQNLDLSVCMIQRDFDTNVIVGEQGGERFAYFKQWAKYVALKGRYFHRTRYLNEMAKMADTEILVNFDCDCFIPPMAVILCVESLRSGKLDFCYPYKDKMARVPRNPWFKDLEKHLDLGILAGHEFKGMRKDDALSVGGAVMYRKDKFMEAGMENENMVSWGPEDCEREYRWKTLGYKVGRVGTVIYHCDHWTGENSSGRHVHHDQNNEEWRKIREMNKEQLLAYIKTWPWKNQ